MLSLRAHAIIRALLLAALIAIAMAANALQSSGVIHDFGDFKLPFLILIFVLFLGFGFSAIPVMVKLILGFQCKIGNENAPVVAASLRAENVIIYAIWVVLASGLAIALPAVIDAGFFNPSAEIVSMPRNSPGSVSFGSSSGTLVGRPGMLLSEMIRASTLPVDSARQTTWTGSIAGGALFEFKIAGTDIAFPRCRYYFVSTYPHDPQRIESLDIGTSPSIMSRAELVLANTVLRRRLAVDGWLTGHEEYRTEEDRLLHEGLRRGPDGKLWLKNGLILDIETRRMDDAVAGEDKEAAGRWIQSVELWSRDDYPSIERYDFAAWNR